MVAGHHQERRRRQLFGQQADRPVNYRQLVAPGLRPDPGHVPGGVQTRMVGIHERVWRAQQPDRNLGDRLQRVGGVESLAAPDRPRQPGAGVKGRPQVVNR